MTWMRANDFDADTLRAMRDALYAQLDGDDEPGFRRPFAALEAESEIDRAYKLLRLANAAILVTDRGGRTASSRGRTSSRTSRAARPPQPDEVQHAFDPCRPRRRSGLHALPPAIARGEAVARAAYARKFARRVRTGYCTGA